MNYTIQNDRLRVSVDTKGAQLLSIRDADGTEYLWQGDPKYWEDRSPNLFPYIGRMIHKQYSYQGKQYPMDIHGFAPYLDFELLEHKDDRVTFRLRSSETTRRQYPWEFTLDITYQLFANQLQITFSVENKSETTMLFAVGGHPGFQVPLCPQDSFEDYRLRFSESCQPERILFTHDCFVEDCTAPYPLENGDRIPLRHDLFDQDAIVLKHTAKAVTLESTKGGKSVTVRFPQMEYIGFWHTPKVDAPYVCIEPWSSLPSPKGEETVLEQQKDMLQLAPGSIYQNIWCVEIN